ncbi:ATP-binding protein [Tahibacter amnicola]|uniref:histidine kinase n=1 Tax=Tahibacter amnicola TaxID=2976241 RepID=A0ABY6BKB6_9GAMM|nr:ATP-binding protein [Tahibacter amnicola]UXI70463.1 ATP-binding protein [Tahibacter amnicola]
MKILIADDDVTSRLLLQATLKKMGHEVVCVENGSRAWEAWQRDNFPVVISDWIMPELDGPDFCRLVRSHPRAEYTFIILLTALDGKGRFLDGMNAGADDFITKPFDEEQLAARLRSAERILSLIRDRVDAEEALQRRNAELEAVNEKLAGTQRQLVQSEKMASVGQLAAGVAHEINNPIGFVQSNLGTLRDYTQRFLAVIDTCEALARSVGDGQPVTQEVADVLGDFASIDYLRKDVIDLIGESLDGIKRVEIIVQDLKCFARLDDSQWEVVDPHVGLETAVNIASHELRYKAEIRKEYSATATIQCMPFQLNQVFLNLLVNAAQAIPGHGTITIRTQDDGDMVRIQISDNGVGIAPEHRDRIFDPFFTTKPVGVGTGLGLSVSYGIVDRHGGRIDVDSELGKGTTFTVRLPKRQISRAAGSPAEPPLGTTPATSRA